MASDYVSSNFLLLPNEIIHSVFDYLSPTDLMISFGYLLNKRLQSLITVHVSSSELRLMDSSSFQWLSQHLSVVQKYVNHISVDIEFVENLLEVLPVLNTLTITFDEDTQHLVDRFVINFQKITNVRIGTIKFSTFDGAVRSKTAELLLGGNGQLPEHTLIIDNCRFQIDIHRLPISDLRHINLIVQDEKVLHALCAHLPNLETIQTGFMSSGLQVDMSFYKNLQLVSILSETDDTSDNNQRTSYPKYKAVDTPDNITVVALPHLRSVIINGHLATFDRLSCLFELSSASLKTIKLNIWVYSIINPEQINNVASHIDFQFDINYDMIGVPSDFDWQKYVDRFTRRPILRCYTTEFCNLSSVINRSIFWLKTTKMFVSSPHTLCFSQVHTLKFQYCKITMNTETVKFIKQVFPKLHTLIWRLSQPKVSTTCQLDMVNTLAVHSEDSKTLGSLLLLCPNVNRLYFTQVLKQDEQIQNPCKQITLIQLVPEDDVTKQQINESFPNANVTYDAQPYYARRF